MKNFVIIDGKGHLFGRLASICAKELLSGKKIVVLRSDKIEISGKHIKTKLKILSRFKKRTNTNSKRGPFHFRNPSLIFWKGVRGMLPHKIKKGTNALKRLRVYEGVPLAFWKIKKMVIPSALRVLKLAPGRKYSILGNISSEIGWTKKNFITETEENRESSNRKFFFDKKKIIKIIHNTKNINFRNKLIPVKSQ
mmetsp:Transcript_3674/g.7425  ORF Transcript_3674/g.7425 Transcript_3674/m.7425 type:complete len:195 (-) Transcript_3674:1000-1584(-)